MKIIFVVVSTILIGHSLGSPIIYEMRDKMHNKFFGHGLHGEGSAKNSPIININNFQDVSQQSSTLSHGQHQRGGQIYGGPHQPTSDHKRGDYGTLFDYEQHKYGGHNNMGNGGGYMNSNIKAGGLKYHHGGMSYGAHNTMKQESYHHREGPKFGQHHDTNMFGNTKIASSSSASSSASMSSSYVPHLTSASSSSSSAASLGGAVAASASSASSNSIGGGGGGGGGVGRHPFNTRVIPWRQ